MHDAQAVEVFPRNRVCLYAVCGYLYLGMRWTGKGFTALFALFFSSVTTDFLALFDLSQTQHHFLPPFVTVVSW